MTFFTLLLACEMWAPRLCREALTVKGDNTGALEDALRMKGRVSMNHVAREFGWRKARYGWTLDVVHLPSELNDRADALSRLHAPKGSTRSFPEDLRHM